jgi:hypothetical protein
MNKSNPVTSTAFTYSMDGHSFYQVNMPTISYLFDNLSNAWSQLSTNGGRHLIDIRVDNSPWPGVNALNAVCFDYLGPNVYLANGATYTDGGSPILRQLISKHVFTDYENVTIKELYIDCEVGTADVPGSGSPPRAPQVMLEWSKDGGRTYGNQIWQPIGNIGNYKARAVWRNLGLARDWVFRFSFSENNKFVIVNAAVRVA